MAPRTPHIAPSLPHGAPKEGTVRASRWSTGTGRAGAEGIARVCLTCWHDVGAIAWRYVRPQGKERRRWRRRDGKSLTWRLWRRGSGGGAARNSGGAQPPGRAPGEARRQPAAAAGALTQDARTQVRVFQTAGSQRTGYDGHLVARAKPLIVALDAQRLGPGASGGAQ
ncbi:hypothetical protein FGB62_89g08 [Gracilaria domingensis]|nr:hypothetical protein FGB62_89g08 [Gracilaria domingensis]